MNQEKIAKTIKEIRTKNGLSQAEFANKYNVTYQAVSKWENAKSIPDISILREICNDYNIDINDLLENNVKKDNKYILIFLVLIVLLSLIVYFGIKNIHKNDFEFKTISSNCNNFTVTGSMAYDHKKSSIYISSINYCGGDDLDKYTDISCALYEANDKVITEISSYSYNDKEITLEKFLKDVNFKVDNYEKTCKSYLNNSLYMEIVAKNKLGDITTYKIPLELDDNC